MDIVKLPSGVRASSDTDCISIQQLPGGQYVLNGSVLVSCGDTESEESVALIGGDPYDSYDAAEEAGLAAREWRQVLSFELSNSVTDERGFGYLATGLYPAPSEPDDTELIRLARVPFREALDAALSGHMSDMITVALLLRAYHMAREGELAPALTEAML